VAASYLGAFGGLVDSLGTEQQRVSANAALGAFGVPSELLPFQPRPIIPTVQQTTPTANIPQEDGQQIAVPSLWDRYKRLIIIGGVAVLALALVFKKRRK
jgi:hypothetical protein